MPETKTLDDVETWENIGKARFVLRKFSQKGDLVDELIPGGKRFHVTTRERQINSEQAANNELDPFSNGMFTPVRLIETTDDIERIVSNPNLMSEDDMTKLVTGRIDSLRRRLGEVRNPVLLDRLLAVAVANDAPMSKVDAIKERLVEVAPSLYQEASPMATTPTAPPAPPRTSRTV